MKRFFELIKKNKFKIAIGLLILFVAIVTLPQRIRQTIAGPQGIYETVKVKKGDIIQSISASGEVESQKQVTLQFQTSGKLAWVGVKEGDHVRKWQAIASLDKRELEKDLKKELNDYLNERWDFEQAFEDYDKSGLPEEKWLVTDAIKRILQKAQFDLNNAIIDVEIADLTIKLATIVTPIDGIITNIESPVAGVNITPATARFTIANPGNMKFMASVDESDIGKIRVGQKVILSLDAYLNEEIEGQVTKIAFASITTKGGGTAFPVDITFPENIEQKFKVGMNGDAEIVIEEKIDVLTIPSEAIKRKAGKTYVQVIEGRVVKDFSVEVGIENETKTEITQGLSEGQLVIIGEKKK